MKLGVFLAALSALASGCTSEDVVLITVETGGRSNGGSSGAQGGSGQGGAAQGGAPSGGTAQGGAAQGGAAQGGAAQGGDVSASGGSGAGGATGMCRSNSDCDPTYSCQKTNCSDDMGRCEKRPVLCEGTQRNPVCGCDNINYWNDCWRRQVGPPASTTGECTRPMPCRDSRDCSNKVPGGQCARLVTSLDPCGPGAPPVPGVCWVVADSCATEMDSERWIECGSPPPGRCVDTCTAITEGHPFIKAPPNACQ